MLNLPITEGELTFLAKFVNCAPILLCGRIAHTAWSKSKDIKRVHSSQNKSHARSAILRMRNLPASTVKFFYKEIDWEIRIFVIKTAILTKLSR